MLILENVLILGVLIMSGDSIPPKSARWICKILSDKVNFFKSSPVKVMGVE